MSEITLPYLKKMASLPIDSGLPRYRVALLGDCSTQHIATSIRGFSALQGMNVEMFEADYNQIIPQITDTRSELYDFAPQAVIIFMCTEVLYEKYCATPMSERDGFSELIFNEIVCNWDRLERNFGKRINILQTLFAEYDDRVFGNFGARVSRSFIYQLRRLNFLISERVSTEYKSVYTIDLQSILCRYSEFGRDDKLYNIAKIPFSTECIPKIAEGIVGVVKALCGKITKCVILDLDNTLWGGVIGDDGINGIQIGELGIGHAFTEFQMWLKELKTRGIILAVCSKNDEKIAKEPFISHPDMILSLDDISVFTANWNDKPSNIRDIQRVLNIGFDSMVFIDDNPFEREAVRLLIPEITVPEMPDDPSEYVDFLRNANLFEAATFSDEDIERTSLYKAEICRSESISNYDSYNKYLEELKMIAENGAFYDFLYPRIAQLTQRSNQFNLRTVRYTETDISEIATNHDFVTRYFKLKDRFGDNGLISVVIMKKISSDSLFIDTWVMSCRVLKRGMEEYIINKIVEIARGLRCRYIVGEYIKTPKNSMVENVYLILNFESESNNIYKLDVCGFKPFDTFISDADNL